MRERIKGESAGKFGGRVAKPIGQVCVGGFMDSNGKNKARDKSQSDKWIDLEELDNKHESGNQVVWLSGIMVYFSMIEVGSWMWEAGN